MKRGRMNVLQDYHPWQINTKPLYSTTSDIRNRKIPRFDFNNPIMSWGQKTSLFKIFINLSGIKASQLKGHRPDLMFIREQ